MSGKANPVLPPSQAREQWDPQLCHCPQYPQCPSSLKDSPGDFAPQASLGVKFCPPAHSGCEVLPPRPLWVGGFALRATLAGQPHITLQTPRAGQRWHRSILHLPSFPAPQSIFQKSISALAQVPESPAPNPGCAGDFLHTTPAVPQFPSLPNRAQLRSRPWIRSHFGAAVLEFYLPPGSSSPPAPSAAVPTN